MRGVTGTLTGVSTYLLTLTVTHKLVSQETLLVMVGFRHTFLVKTLKASAPKQNGSSESFALKGCRSMHVHCCQLFLTLHCILPRQGAKLLLQDTQSLC